jgi:1,4-dihydroxy-2-naphthoate octaprenyltransferase
MKDPIGAWFRIIRIQFYPMTWIAYSLGAVSAVAVGARFHLGAYIVGYICLFLIELATILMNEYFDYESDVRNQNAGPYTGGSRMLPEGRLTHVAVRTAAFYVLGLMVASGVALVFVTRGIPTSGTIVLLLLGLLLGLGYTTPPFKFSYRGMGELVVGLIHGPYVVVCGFFLQTGTVASSLPWLLSVPVFFAVFAAITLAGLPDRPADAYASKRTLAVLHGPKKAALMAFVFTLGAAAAAITLVTLNTFTRAAGITYVAIAVPFAVLVSIAIARVIKTEAFDRRIDAAMQAALSYIIVFGVVPLVALLLLIRP